MTRSFAVRTTCIGLPTGFHAPFLLVSRLFLFEYMQRQLDAVTTTFHRYIYPNISWDNRMLGIVGPRGVGKTTLFLQRIKEMGSPQTTLYVSADHMYFADHTLFDTADAFVKNGGTHLFIDEVHKYPEWSRELKMMYDSLPDLHVYFTGSSVLDIEKGEADLSRRAPKYELQGLSFREYLAIRHGIVVEPFTLEEIVSHAAHIPGVSHPLPLFRDYLRCGYYPFGSDVDFEIELDQVITRTLEGIGNVRETFFLNQMRVNNKVVASKISDFQIGDMTFEVGGKNKGQSQVREAGRGFVVKDDIEYGCGNVIPLWAFGLNY